jgi:hypothetical protein
MENKILKTFFYFRFPKINFRRLKRYRFMNDLKTNKIKDITGMTGNSKAKLYQELNKRKRVK